MSLCVCHRLSTICLSPAATLSACDHVCYHCYTSVIRLCYKRAMLQLLTDRRNRLGVYVAELCTLARNDTHWLAINRVCHDGSAEPAKWNIPILPCNFIAVQPQLYSGTAISNASSRTIRSLPFISGNGRYGLIFELINIPN